MFKFLKINSNSKSKYIYHMDKELKKEVDAFLRERFPDCSDISFSVIIENFFDTGREIYFKKNSGVYGIGIYYSYDKKSIDEKSTIRLICSRDIYGKVRKNRCDVEFSSENRKLEYNLGYINGNFRKELKVDSKCEYIGGKFYYRSIYGDCYNIIVRYNNREIILKCSGNINGIRNELQLKEYLLNVRKIDSIKDIYNKIYTLALREDMNIHNVDLIIKENGVEVSKLHIDKSGLGLLNRKHQYEIIENDKRLYYLYEEPSHTMVANSIYDGVINIVNGDYTVAILFPYFSGCGREDLLKDYLLNLEFPVKIEDICKNIAKEFMDDACFKIEIMYKKETTDLIKIYKNNLVSFKSIRDNKVISIDENGVFSYSSVSGKKKIVVDIIGDVVTKCEYSSLTGIESDNMGNSIYDGINEAKDVKVRIKKMMDNLISRDNS